MRPLFPLLFFCGLHLQDRESSQYYAPPKPVNDGDATEEVPGSKQRLLNFKANFCDLSESRVFRTRFPLSSIIGLRLQAGAKTESHLPVPHVLILELSSPVPPEGFAVRSVNPKEQRHVGWSTCADWTPDCTASSGTRHYIYGDEKELRELALYLLKISPGLSAMYRSPNNTLMTSQVCLLPSGAPRARARAHQGSSSAAGGPQGLQCPGGKSFPSQWGPIPGLAGWQKEFEETIFHRRLNPECKCLMPISEEDVSQIGQFVKVQGQVPLPELAIVGLTVVCDALGLDLESCGGDDSNDEEEDEEFEDESESSKWETDDEDEQEEEDVGPSRDLPSRRIDLCAFCDSPEAKLCAGCKEIRYCSLQCQKSDWKTHKADCKQAQARAAAQSAQQEPAVPVAENQRRILKAKRNPLKEQRLNL